MEDDLRVLLRSPALTLEPPTTLPDVVRRKARRRRMRARAGGAVGFLAVVAIGLLAGPGLKDSIDGLRSDRSQPAELKPDPRFPTATTEVVTLQRINGAEVLTWFEGADWCTATTRVKHQKTCLGPINPAHQGFSRIVPSGSASVTVDNEHMVAGLVPPGASSVVVHMKDGREYDAQFADGARFLVPVWSSRIDDSTFPVEYYAAFDSVGREIARQPVASRS
ncbi:MAG: hypothetical protein QOJ79_1075 [Actinomycetota bacterium]|jgi:hypothetical protein|nr:hypothetical protein [Actinomycetota bacterium]